MVNYAARIVGMVRPPEVWVSDEAKKHIEQVRTTGQETVEWLPHPGCELQGFPGQHILWSVASGDGGSEEFPTLDGFM